MAREQYAWLEGEWTWNADGSVGLETLPDLRAEESHTEPVPEAEPEADQEPKPVSDKRDAPKSRRHLAGANWLEDWTHYFPVQTKPRRKKPKK